MGCKKMTEAKWQVIRYAQRHIKKPLPGHRVRGNFENFCRLNARAYDPQVRLEIIKIRPNWFVKTSTVHKKTILRIAKNGGKKPLQTTKLGVHLRTYFYKSGGSYDPHFAAELRSLRPEWCIPERWIKMLDQIMQMALLGKTRPSSLTKTGSFLRRMMLVKDCKANKYNPKYLKELKKIRPDWF